MRYFRLLPPQLRVASLLGLLFALASLVVLIEALITSLLPVPPRWSADATRLLLIGLNLGMVSGACSFVVYPYSLRFRRSHTGPFLLTSWQGQVRAFLLLAVLPISALVLAFVIPPTSLARGGAILISCSAAFVLLIAQVYGRIRWLGMD